MAFATPNRSSKHKVELTIAWTYVVKHRPIGYIVLPPGHGKSFHHNSIVGLVEADEIFNCKGDTELQYLRNIARHTNLWCRYDDEWAARLSMRLTQHRWVVMVPSREIGNKIGGVCLGVGQLSDDQWNINLIERNKTVKDYNYARQYGSDVVKFSTNQDLSRWLLAIADIWLSNR